MQHRKDPAEAHHSLMRDLVGLANRYDAQGMPGVERIAVFAQFIGKEIAALPKDVPYTPADLLTAVARNIEAGNRAAPRSDGPGGALVGFAGTS